MFSINIGKFNILKYLFEHYAKSPKDRNVMNSTGNTILHVACIFPTGQTAREIAINIALNHDVDPFVKNHSKKMAVDCFIFGGDSCKKMLQDKMKKTVDAGNAF